jgi:branched-chain amino acid transport system permease protein
VLAPEGLYVRLRARPWRTLAVFAVIVLGLRVANPFGEPLDWILIGALAAVVVAVLPGRTERKEQRTEQPTEQSAAARQPATQEAATRRPAGAEEPTAEPTAAKPGAGELLVECADVARYFGGVRALDGVTLRVSAGELVGLVGPNGSGKTTLVSLLAGTLRPSRGAIRIAGRNTAGLSPHRVAHTGVARTYQIPRPFGSMTVRDNIAMAIMFGLEPRSLPRARVAAERHIGFVGLGHLADVRPSALNLHQRQLLEMARALATNPKVLLLDEALAGLNPAEIDNAVEVVRRIQRGGTAIVIVEHLLRVVNQLATRIVVLDKGTVLADGDPQTVMRDPAVVQAYLGKRAHA